MMLANFPIEVLTEITALTQCSDALLLLWKCGSRILQAKLAQCVTIFDLKDKRLVSRSRYPRLISSFLNLRSLSLNRGKWPLMSSGYQLSAELSSLRLPKLETLALTGGHCDSALVRCNDDDQLEHPVQTAYSPVKTLLWNLSESFPMLRTLKLDFKTRNRKALHVGLPSTLTHLAMPMDNITNFNTPYMSLLPADLLHLEASIYITVSPEVVPNLTPSCLAWANPPRDLHTISSVSLTGANPSSFGFLPRTMTHCNLGSISWTVELIATLPPGFGTIELDCGLPNASELIPPMVRRISSHTFKKLPTSINFFESLPRTLTTLKLEHWYDDSEEWPAKDATSLHSSFWPPALTTLDIMPYLLNENDIETLPTTLKHLEFCWNSEAPIDCSKLPRGLAKLNVLLNDDFGTLSLLPGFSDSLTTLSLIAVSKEGTLDSKILSVLPSSLRWLDLQSTLLSISCEDIKWPTALTKLSLSFWPFDMLSLFPPSLRHFNVISTLEDSFSPDLTKDYFEHLPVSLETIDLYFESGGSTLVERIFVFQSGQHKIHCF